MSLGILGGTFNPPHLGHLALAGHARDELGLERVLLMPVHAPHKPLAEDPGPMHRLAMCELAVLEAEGISACALEVRRGGPSYTADTLAEIHALHPQAELTFIVGADTAQTLPSWHEPREVLRLADLAVAEREGSERAQVLDAVGGLRYAAGESERAQVLDAIGGLDHAAGESERAQVPDPIGTLRDAPRESSRLRFLAMSPIEISSSMVRGRVAQGLAVEDLVGAGVASYIAEHGLYGARSEGES